MPYGPTTKGWVRETFLPDSEPTYRSDAMVWYPTYVRETEHAKTMCARWLTVYTFEIFSKREYSDRHAHALDQMIVGARPMSAAMAALLRYADSHTPPWAMTPQLGAGELVGPPLAEAGPWWHDVNLTEHDEGHAQNLAICQAEAMGMIDGRAPGERRRFT